MKIAQISFFTPTATNFRAASALSYHLIKFKDKSVELEIWTFNLNECSTEQIRQTERELQVKIHQIPTPKWMNMLNSVLARLFLPYPFQYYLSLPSSILEEVNVFLNYEPTNGIWIYGEDMAHMAEKFSIYPCVITTPDCEAMYYYRMLSERGIPLSLKSLFRYGLMYHRYAKMASKFPSGNSIKYHLVGKEDTFFLRNLNPCLDAYFIRHPHYDLVHSQLLQSKIQSVIDPLSKIRLLIAGRYDIYMHKAVDEAVQAMVMIAPKIRDYYHITFLGKNWSKCVRKLQTAGFSVESKGYVEDYISEVFSHDIQLTPISVGTGTKGKVLDAFANGLMVMGTLRALENIAVENGVSCIQYESAEELQYSLIQFTKEDGKQRVKSIARCGHLSVLKEHSRERIAQQFYKLFK